jgi:hypothetical protein
MRQLPTFLVAVASVVCGGGLALAADQTILGKSLVIKGGADPAKRKITVTGKEKNSANSVVGNPTQIGSAGGAILELTANGVA